MDEKDFEAREGAYKTVNEGTTVTQQTALRVHACNFAPVLTQGVGSFDPYIRNIDYLEIRFFCCSNFISIS